MPTYIAYNGSKQIKFDTQREVTVVLLGQRDADKEQPTPSLKRERDRALKVKDAEPFTKEDAALVIEHRTKLHDGYFALQPLNWLESEELAEADKANWPDRINFRIIKVDTHLR